MVNNVTTFDINHLSTPFVFLLFVFFLHGWVTTEASVPGLGP